MIAKKKPSILLKLSKEASREFTFPLFLALAFETISLFQIISTIIKSSFPESTEWSTISDFLKNIFLATSVFGAWDILGSSKVGEGFWIAMSAIIVIYFLLLLAVFVLTILDKRLILLSTALSIISLIHSRILFYPIHYYYLQVINLLIKDKYNDADTFFKNAAIKAITIVLTVISLLLALLKEAFFYRINKNRNAYSAKNNTQPRLNLIYKAIAPMIFIWMKDIETGGIIVCIFAIVYSLLTIYSLYTKLPFYRLPLLKYSYGLSGLTLSFAIIGLINSIGNVDTIPNTLLVACATMLVKVIVVKLDTLYETILMGEIDTPEKAIHFPILLKQYTSKYAGLILVRKNFPREAIFFYSLFDPKLSDPNTLKDSNAARLTKQEFYSKIIEKITSKTRNSKSEIFLLYLARIFMKKLNNPAQALNIIEKLKGNASSIALKNSVESVRSALKDSYFKNFTYQAQDLELANYFAYREEFNSLKDSMQDEIKHHLSFWQELLLDEVNVKAVVDLSNRIDNTYVKIRDRWKKSSETFAQIYPSSLLMYGLYLDSVRGLPQESVPMIQKFYNFNKSATYNKKVGSLSETAAIIVASIEKDKVGQVVDASNTVQSLFGVTRDQLVGDKVNILMPNFIAKIHDSFMQKYVQSSVSKAIDRQIISYGKTSENALIELEISIKVFPYLDKGVNLMAYVKQVATEDMTFIVRPDGQAADCSAKLQDSMNTHGINFKTMNFYETCPQFGKINSAFNMIFTPVDPKLRHHMDETEISLNTGANKTDADDLLFVKDAQPNFTYTYTQHDTITDRVSPMKTKTADDTPLMKGIDIRMETSNYEMAKSGIANAKGRILFDKRTLTLKSFKPHVSNVNEEEAQEMCSKYQMGSTIKFEQTGPNFGVKKPTLMLEVRIEPYVLAGEVYKVVKVVDIQQEDQLILIDSDPARRNPAPFLEMDLRAETMSPFESRAESFRSRIESGADSSIPDERIEGVFHREQTQKFTTKTTTTKRKLSFQPPIDATTTQKKMDSLGQMAQTKEELHNIDIRQSLTGKGASSTKSYSHMDYKLIKTLNDFFGERNVRLVTRISILAVYAIMCGILALSLVNYFMTKKSLKEIDDSVIIIDTSSRRLTSSLRAWQWMLILYTRVAGLRSRSYLADTIQGSLVNESLKMQTLNNELRTKLNFVGTEEILKEIFATKIEFWDPRTHLTVTDNLGSFTANNLLVLNNLVVGNGNYTDAQLLNMIEPKVSMNNTGNDYLISSESQINDILGGLQKVIKRNTDLLRTILIFENLALLALCVALFAVARVVLKSYSRAFQALVRITTESIEDRIYRIKKFQTSLSENIEAKSFVANLNLYMNFFEDTAIRQHTQRTGKSKDGKKQRFFNKRYTNRRLILYILKYLAISYAFVAIISGIFIFLFTKSLNSFDLLDKISNQLTVTNKVSYQSSLVVSNFYFMAIFINNSTYLIRNEAPSVQLTKNLETFSEVNENLINTLLTDDQNDYTIQSFLKDNICEQLAEVKDMNMTQCYISSQGGTLGLLSYNAKILRTAELYIGQYSPNLTTSQISDIVKNFFEDSTLDAQLMDAGYTFLTEHILAIFNDEVSRLDQMNLLLSLMAIIFILLTTLLIQKITLSTLIDLDNSQKKIFRSLTYYVFSQNKSVGFLMKKEFGDQIEGLNRILYS